MHGNRQKDFQVIEYLFRIYLYYVDFDFYIVVLWNLRVEASSKNILLFKNAYIKMKFYRNFRLKIEFYDFEQTKCCLKSFVYFGRGSGNCTYYFLWLRCFKSLS